MLHGINLEGKAVGADLKFIKKKSFKESLWFEECKLEFKVALILKFWLFFIVFFLSLVGQIL
jgi:hypothetical protein